MPQLNESALKSAQLIEEIIDSETLIALSVALLSPSSDRLGPLPSGHAAMPPCCPMRTALWVHKAACASFNLMVAWGDPLHHEN